MGTYTLKHELETSTYPGRGIFIGRSDDGSKAVIAYFIMGRSRNSRNRVFTKAQTGWITQVYDKCKLEDPSLILYSFLREFPGKGVIVTNGDQTDTIYDHLATGKTFEEALQTREHEPDSPHFTPRISAVLNVADGEIAYQMSILSRLDDGESEKKFFNYTMPEAGAGHFLHTYFPQTEATGDVLPSFKGEPKPLNIGGKIDSFTKNIWDALNEDNKISLYVRYQDLTDGSYEERVRNKVSDTKLSLRGKIYE